MRALARTGLAILFGGLVAGCASHKIEPATMEKFFAAMASCREEFAALDARVAAAGVGNAAYYRVRGFPYFRTDRLLASFANEVTEFEALSQWTRRMRELDREAREFEYVNLGLNTQEAAISRTRMQLCSSTLSSLELENPRNLKILKAVVTPPDEYSARRRILGIYPLAVPIMKSRLAKTREALANDFSRPLAELDSAGPLTLWSVEAKKDPEMIKSGFSRAIFDELGFPGLVDSQWLALAEKFAPLLWIETATEADVPGTPVWSASGITVDTNRPLVNYHISYARFGTEAVAQITYFVWFRGSDGVNKIDGNLWRVTLDLNARPLAYESLHGSGQSHMVFPVQKLVRREDHSYWQQEAMFPQDSSTIPDKGVALRLGAGTHALRRLVFEVEALSEHKRSYQLVRYEELYRLRRPDGSTQSLFGSDGLIAGTDYADGNWLWASGVRKPGALRQYGRHVTSYVGRRHFDDALLLEKLFLPPTWASREKPEH